MIKFSSKLNRLISDFKAMPFFLKLLFICWIYSLITHFFDFLRNKPVTYQYFGSSFPKNYPFIWNLYNLLLDIYGLIVFLKRSYSILKKYIYTFFGLMILSLLIMLHFLISNMPVEKWIYTIIVFALAQMFVVLIFVYLLKQKRYFNKP